MRRFVILLCALALLTSCTGGSGTGSPTPSEASPTPAPNSLVVAVPMGEQGVSLYRIGEDRGPVHVRTLPVPDPPAHSPYRYAAIDIGLGEGPSPLTCVVWGAQETDSASAYIRCYPFGDSVGFQVPDSHDPLDLALSADGSSLAWTSQVDEGGNEQDLVTATLRDGQPVDVRRHPTVREGQETTLDTGCDTWVAGLAWAGDRLLVECNGENDYPGGFQLQATDLNGKPSKVEDEKQPPYNYYRDVLTADATSALAIQGEYCEIECPDKQPPAARRAVRFDLATGKVLEVIARPAAGRYMESVSGGPHGVLYVTSGSRAKAVYVRFPGEKHGTRVEGLPVADGTIVAQP